MGTLARWGTGSDGNTGPTGLTGRARSTNLGLHHRGDDFVHRGEFRGPAARAAGAGEGRRGGGAQVSAASGPWASAALLHGLSERSWCWRRAESVGNKRSQLSARTAKRCQGRTHAVLSLLESRQEDRLRSLLVHCQFEVNLCYRRPFATTLPPSRPREKERKRKRGTSHAPLWFGG